jgi:hypothetical protein
MYIHTYMRVYVHIHVHTYIHVHMMFSFVCVLMYSSFISTCFIALARMPGTRLWSAVTRGSGVPLPAISCKGLLLHKYTLHHAGILRVFCWYDGSQACITCAGKGRIRRPGLVSVTASGTRNSGAIKGMLSLCICACVCS